jgi:hypothetical protein
MTQFLIDQETHENCVPREQHRREVAAAEERGAVKERERIAGLLRTRADEAELRAPATSLILDSVADEVAS